MKSLVIATTLLTATIAQASPTGVSSTLLATCKSKAPSQLSARITFEVREFGRYYKIVVTNSKTGKEFATFNGGLNSINTVSAQEVKQTKISVPGTSRSFSWAKSSTTAQMLSFKEPNTRVQVDFVCKPSAAQK